jgi:predicted lipid-binding transport protein (Tim44 family)
MSKHAAPFVLAIGLAATLAAGPADARRGGSFGSRGSRTYYSPRSTNLSPGYVPPVSRSMTSRPSYGSAQATPGYGSGYRSGYRRPGFGGGLLTGLVAGGLIGSLFGHHAAYANGYGSSAGGGGMLALLLQLAILGGLAWLVVRFFRGRRSSAPPQTGFGQPLSYAPATPSYAAPMPSPTGDEPIEITANDQATFERLLGELQDAFGHEDYGRLRAITTPEVMSYLAEELSDNATHGRRNDVTGTRLLDGEVSEAWREGEQDYATIAMRYESVDVMRDRATNTVLAGSANQPTTTAELWTFVRPTGTPNGWKVSAIQEAS